MMLFDETTKSLFPSDLFIQPGDLAASGVASAEAR
jgi:hypothetical protein